MKKTIICAAILATLGCFTGCKNNDDAVATVDTKLNTQVISDFSTGVAAAEYQSLSATTATLYTQALALAASPTDPNLEAAKASWREARRVWEQSEAQLFGPVETDNIDPHIDSWPVDFNALQDILDGDEQFTEDFINNLLDTQKGFHPIEFILWGSTGNKTAAALTPRETDYLVALALNVKTLTANLNSVWDTSSSNNFYADFSSAGSATSTYTQKSALEQLVAAMADICGEVGESKMKEPFDEMDSLKEESPFAKSSMTDFTNNIKGIQNVYLGKFVNDGKGIEDIVKQYNLNLDSEIKEKLSTALASMNAITTPFGRAIYGSDRTKVQAAMTAIGDLKSTLEDKLLPLVKLHAE